MEEKPHPFTAEQLAWLLDLETTAEPQTRGALHRMVAADDQPVGWCCLGRGAVAIGLREAPWDQDEHCGAFSGSATQLLAYRRLHLRDASGALLEQIQDPTSGEYRSTLAEFNDEMRWTFPEIAAYIRAHPWNVFTDPEATHDQDCPHVEPRSVPACTCGFYKRDFRK